MSRLRLTYLILAIVGAIVPLAHYFGWFAVTGGGLGGGHNGRILTMWNKTLDPQSPDFKYSDAVVVASSDGLEDCDAIDPSLLKPYTPLGEK